MADVTFSEENIFISGVSANTIANSLKSSGMTDLQISELMGYVFWGAAGNAPPAPFKFTHEVESQDPKCEASYARAFTHLDWVDGQSRVQAGLTLEEQGFNARFHAIEAEFDTLSDVIADIASCAGAVRQDLFEVVTELEGKITELQNEIHELRAEEMPTISTKSSKVDVLGTTTIGGKEVLVFKDADKYEIIDINSESEFIYPFGTTAPTEISTLLETAARTLIANEEITALVAEGATVDEVIERFGDVEVGGTTAGTVSLRTLLSEADGATHVTNTEELMDVVMTASLDRMEEGQTTAMRRHILSADAANKSGAAIANSGVGALRGMSEEAEAALKSAGFGTIAKLADASVEEVASALGATDSGDAAATIAAAKLAMITR